MASVAVPAVMAVAAPAPGAYLLVYETEDAEARTFRTEQPLIAGGGELLVGAWREVQKGRPSSDALACLAVMAAIARSSGGIVTKRINQIAEKTIDFIELVFDAIIEDGDISDTIKALLLRLQIPVIKASMLD